jgi:hypothetical protein
MRSDLRCIADGSRSFPHKVMAASTKLWKPSLGSCANRQKHSYNSRTDKERQEDIKLSPSCLVQYPPTDRGNEENRMPLPMPPDVDQSNRTMPNLSSGFALGKDS